MNTKWKAKLQRTHIPTGFRGAGRSATQEFSERPVPPGQPPDPAADHGAGAEGPPGTPPALPHRKRPAGGTGRGRRGGPGEGVCHAVFLPLLAAGVKGKWFFEGLLG